MRKLKITEDDLINGWMVKYHGLSLAEAYERQPWTNEKEFYDRYPVTQEQHDEWREWMYATLTKETKLPRKYVERSGSFIYLNCSPKIKKDDRPD